MNDLTYQLAISAGAVPLNNGPLKGTLVLAGADIEAFAALVTEGCAKEIESAGGDSTEFHARRVREKFPMPVTNQPVAQMPLPPYGRTRYDLRNLYPKSQTGR